MLPGVTGVLYDASIVVWVVWRENKTKQEHPSVVNSPGPNGGGHGENSALLMK